MTKSELKIQLAALFPSATFDESGEWLNMLIGAGELIATLAKLRHEATLEFDYLFCLTCVDWKTNLMMVYHLNSTAHRQSLVIKVQLDRNKPAVESVSGIWRTAEFHEREVYEMFGVNFLNHPDLRLLLLPHGWEGSNPLRKDFEDPVNVIKL